MMWLTVPDPVSDDLLQIGERLRSAVQEAGGNRKVADRSGVPVSTLNNYIAGKAEPGALKLAAIAEATKKTVDFFLTGREAVPPASDMVMVPRFELRPSAGKGLAVVPDEVLSPRELIGFSASWLKRLGVDPDYAQLLFAEGDSMEPNIRDGDLLLVNRKIREVRSLGIYIVTWSGMLMVKRAFIQPNQTLVLISDNPVYTPLEIPYEELHSVTIEGRVRWAGRAM